MPIIRSISGLRATQVNSLTPLLVSRYCSAFARFLPAGAIAIARDGRPSGAWIELVAAGTFAAHGRSVHLLGVAPTPTAQLYVEHSVGVAGGVIITASHNPAEWNGMKFLGGDGVFLDGEENLAFWDCLDVDAQLPLISAPCTPEIHSDAIEHHIAAVLGMLSEETLQAIRQRRLKIVVDAVNASGSHAIPALLTALGCEVIPLYCDGTGIFPHTPEPLPVNLYDLAAGVKQHTADMGIAVDPDADRLVMVDETGTPINEELTITLAARAVFSAGIPPEYAPVCVVNLSTTRAVDEAIREFGGMVLRAPVGEINVVRAMQKHRAVIGGEGSGGVIVPACHYGRDSLVGAALAISLLVKTGGTLSQVVGSLPRFVMQKTKFPFSGDAQAVFSRIAEHFEGAATRHDDGLYLDFGASWLHIRTSNTEPIIRAIAESPDELQTMLLLRTAEKAIKGN